MGQVAFKKANLYEVSAKEYRPPRVYEYKAPGGTKTVGLAPVIELRLWDTEKRWSCEINILVDMAADISTLTECTAKTLGIDCLPRPNEPPVILTTASGDPMIGLERSVLVHLGGVFQEVPVIVPVASLKDLQEEKEGGTPLLSSPQFDVLGRTGILENYLLCFDSRRLYVFRRRGNPTKLVKVEVCNKSSESMRKGNNRSTAAQRRQF